MTFSDILWSAMRDKHVSIRKLSEMTGVPKSAIQRYTSGDTEKIPIDRMKLMADALGINPAHIMGWDNDSSDDGQYVFFFSDDDDVPDPAISEIEFALSGEIHDLTESEMQDVLDYVRFKRAQRSQQEKKP